MTLQTVRINRQHLHKPNGEADDSLCPYCGQPISRKVYRQIRARIEAEEKARLATVEEALKARFAAEKAKADAQAKSAIDKAKRDATAQIEKVRREAAGKEASISKPRRRRWPRRSPKP